jgi:hypothetical protein
MHEGGWLQRLDLLQQEGWLRIRLQGVAGQEVKL